MPESFRVDTVPAAVGTARNVALPMQPDAIRSFFTRHSALINATIVVCYLLGVALMVAIQAVDPSRPASVMWWWVPISAAVAVTLWYRPRYPMVGLVLTVALSVTDIGNIQFPNAVALIFFLYALPVYRGVRAAWAGFAVAMVGNVATSLIIGLSSNYYSAGQGLIRSALPLIITTGLWYLVVVVIGINLGNRRRYVAALVAHAEQLVREREQKDALAAAAERSRIAREMHDIVAHSLSVVVTLIEAAAVSIDQRPEAAKNALERASETGRSALAEMRRLLGVLGDDNTGDRAPQPQLADIPKLCSGFEDAGLRITRNEAGVPVADSGHQIAIYRIVQEALTNSLRYAGRNTEVIIDLRHTKKETLITITDSGIPELPAPAAMHQNGTHAGEQLPGSGRGLTGAAQRAEMFGGSLSAGPHGAGWQIQASVPFPRSGSTPEPPTGSHQSHREPQSQTSQKESQ